MKKSAFGLTILAAVILPFFLTCTFETDGNFSGLVAGAGSKAGKALQPPNNVKVTADDTGGIRITWNGPDAADGYTVYRASSTNPNRFIRRGSSAGAAYTDVGASVPPGTPYYYRVEAYNSEKVSAPSATAGPVSAGRNAAILEAPEITGATGILGNITVEWTAVTGATGYILYRSSEYDNDMYIFRIETGECSYTDSGLSPGLYYYQVRGFNSDGEGYLSLPGEADSNAPGGSQPVPAAPVNLKAVLDHLSEEVCINLSWNAVATADKYYVYRSVDDELYEEIGQTSSTTYQDKAGNVNPPQSGGAYYYRVRGYSGTRSGYLSAAYGPVLTLPGKPVVTANVNANSVTLSWPAVYGADTYHVYRSTDNVQFQLLTGRGISGTSYTDLGLSAITYYYRVEASNSAGRGVPSENVAAVVKGTKEPPYTVTFHWTAVTNSTFGSSDISNIAWGGPAGAELFVAVGHSGKMAYSTNGVSWTAVTGNTFNNAFFAVAWSDSAEKFVAVGNSGRIAYSSNGMNWTAVTNNSFDSGSVIYGIAWGERAEKFVAVAWGGKIAHSADGVTWTAVSDSTFGSVHIDDITWGGSTGDEKFVAVGNSGKMAYSADGVNWTAVSDSTFGSSEIANITWGGRTGQEKFVAVGDGGRMAYSADGITWTAVSDSAFESEFIADITWGGKAGTEIFAAVGHRGKMAYSSEGITWTAVSDTAFGSSTIYGISYGGTAGQKKFVAVGVGGRMAYSDGYSPETVTLNASTPTEFNTALTQVRDGAAGGNFAVVVNADISLAPQDLTLAAYKNKTVTLRGNGANRIVSLSANGSLFTVGEDVELILENITLRGRESNNTSLVKVNKDGKLVVNNGGKITGNTYVTSVTETGGGGVIVDGGTLEITGGEISGNTVSGSVLVARGGGIYVVNGSTVLMSGGVIKDNRINKVHSGGDGGGTGGGIALSNNCSFEMTDGTIEGNSINDRSTNMLGSGWGGGVFVNNSTFNFKGGKIRNNTVHAQSANSYGINMGGGVGMNNGNFVMSGGVINGNTISHSINPNKTYGTGGMYADGAYGGGVGGWTYTLVKTGGVIYGGDAAGNDEDGIPLKNTAQSDSSGLGGGHAVFFDNELGIAQKLRRNATSGESHNMDGSVSGSAGGWD